MTSRCFRTCRERERERESASGRVRARSSSKPDSLLAHDRWVPRVAQNLADNVHEAFRGAIGAAEASSRFLNGFFLNGFFVLDSALRPPGPPLHASPRPSQVRHHYNLATRSTDTILPLPRPPGSRTSANRRFTAAGPAVAARSTTSMSSRTQHRYAGHKPCSAALSSDYTSPAAVGTAQGIADGTAGAVGAPAAGRGGDGCPEADGVGA